MRTRWLALLALLGNVCLAGDIFELKEISLDMKHYSEGSKIPMVTDTSLPNRAPGLGVNLNINIDVLRYIYWNNTVHTISDREVGPTSAKHGHHRQIGLEYKVGIRLTPELSFGYHHYSQHNFDIVPPAHRPHEDAFEIKLTIFKDRAKSETLF